MRYIFLILFLISGCNEHPVTTPINPTPVPGPSPKPALNARIKSTVVQSACAKTNWKNRGKAPLFYYEQIAAHFIRDFCAKVIADPLRDPATDALSYYGLPATLKNQYAFLIGLGIRENSGKFCGGRDSTAKNPTAATSETGAFQFSYDSIRGRGKEIFAQYKGACPYSIECDRPDYGTGLGAEFQRLGKTCPAFAIDYATFLIRTRRAHFGPINRKEVEFKSECVQMLSEVEALGCE